MYLIWGIKAHLAEGGLKWQLFAAPALHYQLGQTDHFRYAFELFRIPI